MNGKKVLLIIMDGWGLGQVPSSDAIQHAQVPFVKTLWEHYPHTTLVTFGEAVGLPEGQMGNSEVGHLNIGAGRIVYQELQRINVAIRTGELAANPVFRTAMAYAKTNKKPLHLLGLVSDGGVHSHINHIKAITSLCQAEGIPEVYIHAFTDGRDTDPKSGLAYLKDLQDHLGKTTGRIASVTGRYYAMDRDKRWERVKLAYDALVHGMGEKVSEILPAIEQSYAQNVTDEFIKPIIQTSANGLPLATIKEGDAVICFNFRTDRCREITQVLTQEDMPDHGMHTLKLHYTTMTEYDKTYKGVNVIFETDNLVNTIGGVLEKAGVKQIRIAETEKYPHVTFFFNGGREVPFEGESRIMVPSPKVATYDLKPEMSAVELTDALVPEIYKGEAGFICINYANADMVGHTGVWEAVIKAVETVDACVKRLVTAALPQDYTIFIIADHGNADYMINADGTPNTAHTMNPVPLIVVSKDWKGEVKTGKLGDLAPTMLKVMGIAKPKEMTGDELL
ncbi:MAG: 2,3-bisphosphoglycerate-independent phosphoglycerate mutase [Sphingobacteriales bacterium]|nr:MAG: 2,3-bisphosphoglycerate-independent phosphoglycerate mutase [Sphingobacteriales bacterium]